MGFWKAMKALIRRACGDSPGPGGFFRKSSTSLPAEKESPAPCQSTTRIASSLSAAVKISASSTYMLPVRAFFRSGRFNCTRRIASERSVTMSLIVSLRVLWSGAPLRMFLDFSERAVRAQILDALRVESELAQDLLGVLAEVRCAARRRLGDAMDLNRTADGRGHVGA